jgi:hypothetical protein
MSTAYYHRGLTVELDPSIPRATIDGRELSARRSMPGRCGTPNSAPVTSLRPQRLASDIWTG